MAFNSDRDSCPVPNIHVFQILLLPGRYRYAPSGPLTFRYACNYYHHNYSYKEKTLKRYWAMKTFKEWSSIFIADEIIGIDQDVLNNDYRQYDQTTLTGLINAGLSESIERTFRQFCNWMRQEDLVIIGTGQQTKFNISGIVQVTGDYQFAQNREPRHFRKVKLLKVFTNPQPLQRFARVARLELIDEIDFHESIISLL